MKRLNACLLALGLLHGAEAAAQGAGKLYQPSDPRRDPFLLVDPFIGTGGHGHTHPAAQRPFGMLQAGPDTRLSGWDGCSGYHYASDTLYGFSQTHLSGTGVSDYGDVLIMPFARARTDQHSQTYPYAARFSHADEQAQPGYYRVKLDNGIQVEIAAADRAALYRIIYPPDAEPWLWVDLDHRDPVQEAAFGEPELRSLSGYRISNDWAREQRVYFYLETQRAIAEYDQRNQRTAIRLRGPSGTRAPNPADSGADTVLLRIAISAVDEAGARGNLRADMPGWDFEAARAAAEQAWRSELERVQVAGGSLSQRRIFYTAVYHALCAPNLYADADGRYRAMDRQVHRADGFTPYTVFSLWDTYRAAHPLYTLLWPEHNRQFILTMLDDYRKGGRLPVWKLADTETDCMIGYHSAPVIADAWAKGQRDFDADLALEALLASAERDNPGLNAYRKLGYVPSDAEAESVSKTLEYAYDDACIAYLASDLAAEYAQGLRAKGGIADGRSYQAIADTFARRAAAWKHLLDPETGFFRARLNGGFVEPFDPAEVNFHYTEANAWQYAFSAQHDLAGHAAMLGGMESMAERLDALFSADSRTTGREQVDITGLIGQYAHGNEPSHHIAYLYAHLGQPWKTQQRVRQILQEQYRDAPDGLSGNEDCGQMSAWYVLSASGWYPLNPGQPLYTLGSPLFDTIQYAMPNGRSFRILARNQGEGRPYVSSAVLNGQRLDSVVLRHSTLAAGGELVLTMSERPSREWGVHDVSAAGMSDGTPHPAASFARPAPRAFRDSLRISLHSAEPLFARSQNLLRDPLADADPAERALIAYRIAPDTGWREYREPLLFTGDALLEHRTTVLSRSQPPVHSPVQQTRLLRYAPLGVLTLGAVYAPQYSAGGDHALIDRQRGARDWRAGDWQGYEGVDLIATLDFGESRMLREVSIGFLQDENAWIFFPLQVDFEASEDGQTWRPLGQRAAPHPWTQPGVLTYDFGVPASGRARYLRIRAHNRGLCPPGHKGAGGKAWLFSDELVVVFGGIAPE